MKKIIELQGVNLYDIFQIFIYKDEIILEDMGVIKNL